jgi:flagellar hook-associated protein 1 FlgK
MSLVGVLNAGRSALASHQAAIQVTGNNIANAGNAGYSRQVAKLEPNKDTMLKPGVFVGNGVNLSAIQRQIDEALEGRIRNSVSDNASADTTQQWISRIEAVFNELSDDDLSTQLSQFFNSWSNLANKPQDIGLRQVVLQNGDSLANWVQNVRGDLGTLRSDVDNRLGALVVEADQLAQQVADLNQQIVLSEGGLAGQANSLRDQRDAVLKELSDFINVKTVADGNVINVYVGSEPLVAGTQSRGVKLKQEVVDGDLKSTVVFKADNGEMNLSSGQLGALNEVRQTHLAGTIDKIDAIAGTLIFELNKIHAAGQGMEGFSTITSSNAVDDSTLVLNDPDANMAFVPNNGSFVVHVKEKTTGLVNSTLVQVDLDGLNGDDTTLDSLTAEIDAVDGITATVVAGKLKISTVNNNVEFSFSQDSSGVLAAMGVNTFFTGKNARDIAVNGIVKDKPVLLAAARNGEPGDNQTARAIAALESAAITSLDGSTLKETYQGMVNQIAVASSTAKTSAEAAQVVRSTLEAQREGLSGVSLDEEAINLMRQQRAFQGAARLVAAVDELMKTVLSLV